MRVVPSGNVGGYNFNRYYAPDQGLHHPTLAIRLELDAPEAHRTAIIQALTELVRQQTIRWYSPEPQSWEEPEFVVDAHEASTKCAIEFVDTLVRSPEFADSLQKQPFEFMLYLVSQILQGMGLRPHIAWTYLRNPPPAGMDDLSRRCSEIATEFYNRQTPERKPDFLERFLHTFFNCTISNLEEPILSSFLRSYFWNKLADSETPP